MTGIKSHATSKKKLSEYRVIQSRLHLPTNQPINHSLTHPLPIEPLKLILLSTHNHNLHTKDRLIDIRLELRRAVHVMRVAVFPKQQEPDSSAVAGPGSVRRVGW